MTVKKASALISASALALTLTACGSGDTTDEETTTTVAEQPADDTPEAPAVTDEQAEEWAKSVIGYGPGTSWQDAAHDGAPSWAMAVNRVYYGKGGNVVFEMQLDRTADKDIAEQVAGLYANSMRLSPPEWADRVDYIIVENGVGEHMKQERI